MEERQRCAQEVARRNVSGFYIFFIKLLFCEDLGIA